MTITSTFSDSGLDIGRNTNNLTYLYGLSDFFSTMFEDTDTLNLLMEADTLVASEVYSRFLQFTSTLSLEGIQETTNSSIKLVLLSTANKVAGEINTFTLPEKISSSKYIANRAFLPTELLDQEVDYRISQLEDGTCQIKFAKPISSYTFSIRLLSDGVTEQYAMWFVDSKLDEDLLSKFYGNLIGVTPENASTRFADFVYGLFYVYTHGPKLGTLSRGLNLALGIPVARQAEEVINIRTYLELDQFLVICDQNQYLIPYGLEPSVREGDLLEVGQPLAEWVEIKDYNSSGDWWINLHIPEKLIPEIPAGQKDRYATAGSHYDYLMRNFLKKHTFLVKVKVENFKNIQQFAQISDIIARAKPCYTQCIYIWTVNNIEKINPNDTLTRRLDGTWDESFTPCISRLDRSNSNQAPILRGHRSFIRYNVDYKVLSLCGDDPYKNNVDTFYGAEQINGYVNPISQFRDNTIAESGWMRSILNRGHACYVGYRNKIGFHRDTPTGLGNTGIPTTTEYSYWGVPPSYRVVPLYTTSMSSLLEKISSVGQPTPNSNSWWFEIFSSRTLGTAINDIAVNYLPPKYDPNAVIYNYDKFFIRGVDSLYLGREFGEQSLTTWSPGVDSVKPGDYILCIKITEDVVATYWVTTNYTINAPAYFPVHEQDPMKLTFTSKPSRGMGLNGAPLYVMRGAGELDYNTDSSEINRLAINDGVANSDGQVIHYSDLYNPIPVVMNRSGVLITHAVESL